MTTEQQTDKSITEFQHTATLSREQALIYGAECYSHFNHACLQLSDGWFSFGDNKIYWTEVLHRFLVLNFADVLQQKPQIQLPFINNNQRFYLWKQRLLWFYERLKRRKKITTKKDSVDEVLFVSKHDNHLRDMLPVARVLKEKYVVRTSWLLLNSQQENHISIDDKIISPYIVDLKRWHEEKQRMIDSLTSVVRHLQKKKSPQFLSHQEWTLLLQQTLVRVRLQADYVTMMALLIKSVIESSKPKIILVGNPFVSEGRLLVAAAQGYDIACAFMQHGTVDASDPLQLALPVSRAFVWNKQTCNTLLRCGYTEDQVVVSGAAWLDDFELVKKEKRIYDNPIVIVALSGAGHSIGLDEHKKIVERIYLAAKELPQVRFIFRLHPKDDEKIYQETATRMGNPTCEIVKANVKRNIFDQLAEAHALITVGSTSAIDAFLCSVPVITIEREIKMKDSDYVRRGATTHVKFQESLSVKVDELLKYGQSQEVTLSVQNYLKDFYSVLDKKASLRIADDLGMLVGLSSK